jgi:glycosyltransferase involved in cell wall biosynthesis
VASEAHVSGIPVVGSRIGGLVESIGPGGVLVAPDAPASFWIEALRSIWDDEDRYAALSSAALRYSERPELNQDWATSRMLQEVEAARLMQR